jgi:hypothetical protein
LLKEIPPKCVQGVCHAAQDAREQSIARHVERNVPDL